MKKLLQTTLAASALLLVAATPAEFARETRVRTRGIQDDIKKLEALTQEVVQLSRNVEEAADRIRGPNDVNDIRIVEQKMDLLKSRTRDAVAAAQRVERLAAGIHQAAEGLIEAKKDAAEAKKEEDRPERHRGKR